MTMTVTHWGSVCSYGYIQIVNVKIIKNEIGCRDDTVLKQEGTARGIENIQQSSATPKNHDVGRGLRKIVACSRSSSQCLLVSIVFGTVSSLHPISFLMIFTLVLLIFPAIDTVGSLAV